VNFNQKLGFLQKFCQTTTQDHSDPTLFLRLCLYKFFPVLSCSYLCWVFQIHQTLPSTTQLLVFSAATTLAFWSWQSKARSTLLWALHSIEHGFSWQHFWVFLVIQFSSQMKLLRQFSCNTLAKLAPVTLKLCYYSFVHNMIWAHWGAWNLFLCSFNTENWKIWNLVIFFSDSSNNWSFRRKLWSPALEIQTPREAQLRSAYLEQKLAKPYIGQNSKLVNLVVNV
jgi:hypothetical protein